MDGRDNRTYKPDKDENRPTDRSNKRRKGGLSRADSMRGHSASQKSDPVARTNNRPGTLSDRNNTAGASKPGQRRGYGDGYSQHDPRGAGKGNTVRTHDKLPAHMRGYTPADRRTVRMHRAVLIVGILFFAVIFGVILSLTVFFKTQVITVAGESRYSSEEIIEASGLKAGQNLFLTDRKGAAGEVYNKLPYIEECTIDFKLPDSLIINIKDAAAGYLIEHQGGFLTVSPKGRIIDTQKDNKKGLPVLVGAKLKSTKVGDGVDFTEDGISGILNEITTAIQNTKIEFIEKIDVSDTQRLLLLYDGRITINLGNPLDIDYKIRSAFAAINEQIDKDGNRTKKGTLDVSLSNVDRKETYFAESFGTSE